MVEFKDFYTEAFEVEVTGMSLTKLNLNLEVGELPKISFRLHIKPFLNKLTKEELVKFKEMIEKIQEMDEVMSLDNVDVEFVEK